MNASDIPSTRHTGPRFKYTLTDLVDRDLLQRIQDSFAAANQVASTICDTDGNPITDFSNHSGVCTLIRSTEKGLAKCIHSGKVIGEKAAAILVPMHQQCLSLGFTDAAAPIIVDGHHIANWLIGQYYTREVDEQRIIEYAREIDASTEEMVAAFRAMPRLTRERFEQILDFLWLMANEISRMGYLNLKQREQTEELERVRNELLFQKEGLEQAVAARTGELVTVNAALLCEFADEIQGGARLTSAAASERGSKG